MFRFATDCDLFNRFTTASEKPQRGVSLLWPLAMIAAVAYGSLIPLSFDASAFKNAILSGTSCITFESTTLEDIVTNLLVYVPIGMALMLCGRCRLTMRIARLPVVLFVGGALSLALELLQTGISMRVASLTDVLLNVMGTTLGAIIAVGLLRPGVGMLGLLRRELWIKPAALHATLLTLGLVLFSLTPFDFVTSTGALHDSFLAARWDLGGPRIPVVGEPPLGPMLAQLTAAVWFGVLGYWLALARRTSGQSMATAGVLAVRHGVILAALIEILQLFTLSHNFDLASMVLRSLACVFGAWCAMFAGPKSVEAVPGRRSRLPLGTPALVALGVFQVAAMVLSHVDPDWISIRAFDVAAIHWIPFESLWRRSMSSAAAEVAAGLAMFGALAMTCAVVLRRVEVGFVWLRTGLLVGFVALSVEALGCCSATGSADITGPILALVAVILAWQSIILLDHPLALASQQPVEARPRPTG